VKSSPPLSAIFLSVLLCTLIAGPTFGMISIGVLTQEKAKARYGITMHARKNGDAGIKVWLEFKKEGWLEGFTYAELRMEDGQGNHLVSARLQPKPVHHGQAKDVTTVAFSVEADHLGQCSFLVVCYGSNEGDVGYYLKVKDFLDLTTSLIDAHNTKPHPSSATQPKTVMVSLPDPISLAWNGSSSNGIIFIAVKDEGEFMMSGKPPHTMLTFCFVDSDKEKGLAPRIYIGGRSPTEAGVRMLSTHESKIILEALRSFLESHNKQDELASLQKNPDLPIGSELRSRSPYCVIHILNQHKHLK